MIADPDVYVKVRASSSQPLDSSISCMALPFDDGEELSETLAPPHFLAGNVQDIVVGVYLIDQADVALVPAFLNQTPDN